MRAELGAWNDGRGIDLESWVGCAGSFSLAVGYASIFWPTFVAFEGYVLRDGFSEQSLRAFEGRDPSDKVGIERVMNHLHLDSVQHVGCADISADKLVALGRVLQQIYQVKLRSDFPDSRCAVDFYIPPDPAELDQYQITSWKLRDEDEPWLRADRAAVEFGAECALLRDLNAYPDRSPLDEIINTLMTELWDRRFGQTEIRTAFEAALADMNRYAAGEERRS